jgi:hypothetical protein
VHACERKGLGRPAGGSQGRLRCCGGSPSAGNGASRRRTRPPRRLEAQPA